MQWQRESWKIVYLADKLKFSNNVNVNARNFVFRSPCEVYAPLIFHFVENHVCFNQSWK